MIRRRNLMLSALAVAAAGARADDVPGFARAAFDAKTLPQLLKALNLPAPTASTEVQLQLPELFEDGGVVPVTLGCALPGVARLLLGVERNPTLLSAIFEPGDAIEPQILTRLKMQETSPVLALAVLKDGRVLMTRREVKITLGGCGGASVDPEPPRPPQPTLIRVQPSAGGVATVRALMKHEMESGQRKDGNGRAIPAWHIQQVVARLNGQAVLTAQWGTAVSRNPFLQFGLRGAKAGDKLQLAWVDNRGASRTDDAVLS